MSALPDLPAPTSEGDGKMDVQGSRLEGLWLPLVTPFKDGELDEASLQTAGAPLCGRAGRWADPRRDDRRGTDARRGRGGAAHGHRRRRGGRRACRSISACPAATPASSSRRSITRRPGRSTGYLIACPYYTRPSQQGLFRHFTALAGHTPRPIIVYNIPYRTGVNLANDTLLRLAELRQHRRRQGLLRRSDADLRPAARAAAGLLRC